MQAGQNGRGDNGSASLDLSFPKIISARIYDASRTRLVWRRWSQIARRLVLAGRPCPIPGACASHCNRANTKSGPVTNCISFGSRLDNGSIISMSRSLGEPGSRVPPRSARRAFIVGSARPALISLLSLSTISAGVVFGAPTPYQELAHPLGFQCLCPQASAYNPSEAPGHPKLSRGFFFWPPRAVSFIELVRIQRSCGV